MALIRERQLLFDCIKPFWQSILFETWSDAEANFIKSFNDKQLIAEYQWIGTDNLKELAGTLVTKTSYGNTVWESLILELYTSWDLKKYIVRFEVNYTDRSSVLLNHAIGCKHYVINYREDYGSIPKYSTLLC